MGKRKIECNNKSCKHHVYDGKCDTCIVLDEAGKCQSFEKGFAYYFHIVWNALGNKNFIDAIEVKQKPDLKIGMYYVMECYGLGFSEMEWGTCRMLLLKDGEDQSKQRESKVQHKEFGWLSPEGTFTESPFGTHEESAEMICERKGFVDEYWKWVKENGDNEIGHLMRDFLSEVKGYCLIHNPTGCGGYIVTNMKSLTKRQKEFLYGYFMDMGDRFKAEQFIKE